MHLPVIGSTTNPRSSLHGMHTPLSSNPCPGGQTHSSRSFRTKPRPGGQVLTGVHSSDASPSYLVMKGRFQIKQ